MGNILMSVSVTLYFRETHAVSGFRSVYKSERTFSVIFIVVRVADGTGMEKTFLQSTVCYANTFNLCFSSFESSKAFSPLS